MKKKQIKDLMVAMSKHGIAKLNYKKDDFELYLEKSLAPGENTFQEDYHEKVYSAPSVTIKPSKDSSLASSESQVSEEPQPEGDYVTSPMVGTFYEASSPDAEPFVKVGDKVEKDMVVCIIEAMKVMNEIKAGVNGTVEEILVDSGQPVEFGTKIFRVV
ncbi:MAG: acetyl-CoA carboxylase biotin carboxyl carrier protein [Chlamydiota bacterium]